MEGEYRTQFVDSSYLEPESGVAWLDSDGVITIRLSTQVIEHFRDVAEVLAVPQNRVRVIGAYLGRLYDQSKGRPLFMIRDIVGGGR